MGSESQRGGCESKSSGLIKQSGKDNKKELCLTLKKDLLSFYDFSVLSLRALSLSVALNNLESYKLEQTDQTDNVNCFLKPHHCCFPRKSNRLLGQPCFCSILSQVEKYLNFITYMRRFMFNTTPITRSYLCVYSL